MWEGFRYFVAPEMLLKVKLEILKHVPLYVHKETVPLSNHEIRLPAGAGTRISSVYLDTYAIHNFVR